MNAFPRLSIQFKLMAAYNKKISKTVTHLEAKGMGDQISRRNRTPQSSRIDSANSEFNRHFSHFYLSVEFLGTIRTWEVLPERVST